MAGLLTPAQFFATFLAQERYSIIMAGAAKKTVIQDAVIEEIELDPSEMMELDKIAEETRRRGIPWEELKAELGL